MEKLIHSYTAGGKQNGTTLMDGNLAIPNTHTHTHTHLPFDPAFPLLGIYPEDTLSVI